MWQKRQHTRDAEAPPEKRLRQGLTELYGSGTLPADRTQEMFEDLGAYAAQAGRGDFQDLRQSRHEGSGKNAARDLRRKLLKNSKWPPMYEASVRMWVPKEKILKPRPVALLLPHEIVHALSTIGDFNTLVSNAGLDVVNLQRHLDISKRLEVPFVSMSLWGDGVPYSWDRKKSVDIWTLSFPGLLEKKHRDIRVTLTALPHEVVVRETQDDIMAILSWSMQALACGAMPTSRHDASDWGPTDVWRKRESGGALLHGALLEVKGDWKQMWFCFGVPGWMSREDRPLCLRCTANKRSLKEDAGPEAAWLKPEGRLSHYQALTRILEDQGCLSPLFTVPFIDMAALRLDWLHVADQGVTPVFLGGLFSLVLTDRALGPNEDARCQWLWTEMQAFYRRQRVKDQLNELKVTMIKPKKGPVEMTGSGAEIRALVPFALELVNSWEDLNSERFAAKQCMQHLAACYNCLSPQEGRDSREMLDQALGFHRNLQVLHLSNPKRWQMRPKVHLFLELAAEGGTPSASWNYREESFGGSVRWQAHRKGGFPSPLAMSRSALTKFCAREALPAII